MPRHQPTDDPLAYLRAVVRWHFSPETGSWYWLQRAQSLDFDPLTDVQSLADLALFLNQPAGSECGGGRIRRRQPGARRRDATGQPVGLGCGRSHAAHVGRGAQLVVLHHGSPLLQAIVRHDGLVDAINDKVLWIKAILSEIFPKTRILNVYGSTVAVGQAHTRQT